MSKGKVKWGDLEAAFDFVSAGTFDLHSAYVSRSTGKTFWGSDEMDDLEELPPDVEANPDYVAVPSKRALDLGNRLVMDFARQEMPEKFEDIRDIFSHQQSLAQCRRWLDRFLPEARRISVSSNAEAARRVESIPHSAAIASDIAARLYNLNILKQNIEDEPDNTTRFLVIGNLEAASTGMDKTSLVVTTGNQPGALHEMLEPFASQGISMTKIESRPSRQGMWSYAFFIDIDGHQDSLAVARALRILETKVKTFKILGSYPRATT